MRKITPFGLKMLLATNLHGVMLFEVIEKMNFAIETDGNIADHVIDNIKVVLKVVIRQQLDDNNPYSGKTRNALKSMLEYGTTEVSHRMIKFLDNSEDSNAGSSNVSKLPPYLFEAANNEEQVVGLSESLSIFINQLVQTN